MSRSSFCDSSSLSPSALAKTLICFHSLFSSPAIDETSSHLTLFPGSNESPHSGNSSWIIDNQSFHRSVSKFVFRGTKSTYFFVWVLTIDQKAGFLGCFFEICALKLILVEIHTINLWSEEKFHTFATFPSTFCSLLKQTIFWIHNLWSKTLFCLNFTCPSPLFPQVPYFFCCIRCTIHPWSWVNCSTVQSNPSRTHFGPSSAKFLSKTRVFNWLFSSILLHFSAKIRDNFDSSSTLGLLNQAPSENPSYEIRTIAWFSGFLYQRFHIFWWGRYCNLKLFWFCCLLRRSLSCRPHNLTKYEKGLTIRLLIVRLNFYISFFLLWSLSDSSFITF